MVENLRHTVEWSNIDSEPGQPRGSSYFRCMGCGAWHDRQWFQLAWDERTFNWHIAAKELVPIIMAAVLWGQKWKGNRVVARCDNTAVVTVLNSRYAKDVVLMRMLRCLFFVEAHFQFSLTASHIPGVHNNLADDLYRNRLPSFLCKMPNVDCTPSIIPHSLLQWLLYPNLDWTSPSWTALFSSSVHKGQQDRPTTPPFASSQSFVQPSKSSPHSRSPKVSCAISRHT